jgi:hypothetical protein
MILDAYNPLECFYSPNEYKSRGYFKIYQPGGLSGSPALIFFTKALLE